MWCKNVDCMHHTVTTDKHIIRRKNDRKMNTQAGKL
jgi:hypothetical protein